MKVKPKEFVICFIVIFLIVGTLDFSLHFKENYRDLNYDYLSIVKENEFETIEKILLEERIDGIPVVIYLTKDENDKYMLYTFTFHGGKLSQTTCVGEYLEKVNSYYSPESYNNINKHKVVYGYCKPNKVNEILVNGKHVDSYPINYSTDEYKVDLCFWYTVIDKHSDFTVENLR